MRNYSHGINVTASNVKEFDNYVLYRIWNEATTKKERSLAMKEIKRRQKLGNMVESHNRHYKVEADQLKWTHGIGWRTEKRVYIFKTENEAKQFKDQMKQINKERASETPPGKKWFSNIKIK